MFGYLGKLVARRPWFVLAFWALVVVTAAPFAEGVGERLSAESEVPTGTESGRVSELVSDEFPGRDPEQLVLAVEASPGGPKVGDREFEDAVDGAVGAIRKAEGVGRLRPIGSRGPKGSRRRAAERKRC